MIDDIHVIPINDLRDHDDSPACWCVPRDDDGVWIHNSMDRREYTIEKGVVQ